MSMSKKDFIALADAIRQHNQYNHNTTFTEEQLDTLARFCAGQSGPLGFKRDRWFNYIAGKCGPSGGAR